MEEIKCSVQYSVCLERSLLLTVTLNHFLQSQMTQNMFQEGLYQVFFKEPPKPKPRTHPLLTSSNQTEVKEMRLARWFGAIVNVRLLITGVRETVVTLFCTFDSKICNTVSWIIY